MTLSERLKWYAVQVRTNHEVRSVASIAAREIECFTPLYEEEHAWSDRVKRSNDHCSPGIYLSGANWQTGLVSSKFRLSSESSALGTSRHLCLTVR